MSLDIKLPDELSHVLSERTKVWSEFESARNRAAQFNQVSQKLGTGIGTDVEKPFSNSPDPRIEIDQTLMELNKQIGEMEQAQKDISASQAEIERIKSHARNMMMMVFGGGAVAVFVIIFLVMNMN